MRFILTTINTLENVLVYFVYINICNNFKGYLYLYLLFAIAIIMDRLCSLVVRVSGYRYRGLGFDSRRYQIFWEVVGMERGPLNLVRSIEELLE